MMTKEAILERLASLDTGTCLQIPKCCYKQLRWQFMCLDSFTAPAYRSAAWLRNSPVSVERNEFIFTSCALSFVLGLMVISLLQITWLGTSGIPSQFKKAKGAVCAKNELFLASHSRHCLVTCSSIFLSNTRVQEIYSSVESVNILSVSWNFPISYSEELMDAFACLPASWESALEMHLLL